MIKFFDYKLTRYIKNKKILVTGSNGLIGGEVVDYFAKKNVNVFGIDNNMRAEVFWRLGKD